MTGFSVRYESQAILGSRLRVGWCATFEEAEKLARLSRALFDVVGCPVFIIDESDGFEVEIPPRSTVPA